MCRELADLCMQVARHAAAAAAQEWPITPVTQPEPIETTGVSQPVEAAHQPEPAAAHNSAATRQPRTRQAHSPQTSHPRPASPASVFIRLVQAICQIMEIETNLAAAQKAAQANAAQHATAQATHPANPRPANSPAPPKPQPQSYANPQPVAPNQAHAFIHRPNPPATPAHAPDITPILGNISHNIGINLEHPDLSTRLPSFRRPPPNPQSTAPPHIGLR